MPTLTAEPATTTGPSDPLMLSGIASMPTYGTKAELLPPTIYAIVTNPGGVSDPNISFTLEFTADQPIIKNDPWNPSSWNPERWVPENTGGEVPGYTNSFQKPIALRATGVRANIHSIKNGATLTLQVIL